MSTGRAHTLQDNQALPSCALRVTCLRGLGRLPTTHSTNNKAPELPHEASS